MGIPEMILALVLLHYIKVEASHNAVEYMSSPTPSANDH